MRADIIIDSIDSLRIVTKTHELDLEETPEKFSTLEGIKFCWTIKSSQWGRDRPGQDSPYNTVPILEQLEAGGVQDNKVLLEGINTDSVKW